MTPTEWMKQVIQSDDITSKTTLSLAAAYQVLAAPDGRVRATLAELKDASRIGSKNTVIKHRSELEAAGFIERDSGSMVQLARNAGGAAIAPQSAATAPESAVAAPNSALSAPDGAATAPRSESDDDGAATAPNSAASAPQSAATAPSPAKEKIPHTPLKENTSLAVAREVEEAPPASTAPDEESPRSLQDIVENEPTERFVMTVAEFFGLDIHFGHAANIWMNAEDAQDSDEQARRYIAQKMGELADGDYASRTIEKILRRDSDRYDGARELQTDGGTSSNSSSSRDIQATGDTAAAIRRKREQYQDSDEAPF